jgi:hypothetical protein
MFQQYGATLLMATATTATPHESRVSFSETALEWIQRTKRKRALAGIPQDPASAAWAFFRQGSSTNSGGTGIAFVDAALRRQPSTAMNNNNNTFMKASTTLSTDQLPVIEIRGSCAKTWTLLTLAARFVVATRPSQFDHSDNVETSSLPQVILLDSTFDHSIPQLVHVVRSTLLRRAGENMDQFGHDLNQCLARIHIVSLTESYEAVAVLETFRAALAPSQSERPTLILWDGYLDTLPDASSRMEVIRQMSRLLQDCSVVFVSTSASRNHYEWDKFVTHRIRQDRNPSDNGHDYLATVHGSRIPFSISLAGILS